MRILLQLLIAGLSQGSFYALIAMGFSIIFGVTHAFNLAHGEMILLGGYLAFILHKFLNLPFFATLPICMTFLALGAMLLHGLLRRLEEPFEMNTLVVTFGLALLLQNVMLWGFSADHRLLASPATDLIHLTSLDLIVTRSQVLLISLSLIATGTVHLILRKTFLGKALRATMQDREAAVGRNRRQEHELHACLGLHRPGGPLFGRTTYLYSRAVPKPFDRGHHYIRRHRTCRSILMGGWFWYGESTRLCAGLQLARGR
jgi:branched-chain amino acid transport system permease protein